VLTLGVNQLYYNIFHYSFHFFIKISYYFKKFCNYYNFKNNNFFKNTYKIQFDIFNYEKIRLPFRHLLPHMKNTEILKCVHECRNLMKFDQALT